MSTRKLELQLENLEGLLDEILALLDDPDIPNAELRKQLRALLDDDNDDE